MPTDKAFGPLPSLDAGDVIIMPGSVTLEVAAYKEALDAYRGACRGDCDEGCRSYIRE